MKCVALLLCVVASASAVSFYDLIKDEWEAYKMEHKKKYNSEVEDKFRMKIFAENKHKIAKHNQRFQRGLEPFSLGQNKYGDMLHHEFVHTMNGFNKTLNSVSADGNWKNSLTEPTRRFLFWLLQKKHQIVKGIVDRHRYVWFGITTEPTRRPRRRKTTPEASYYDSDEGKKKTTTEETTTPTTTTPTTTESTTSTTTSTTTESTTSTTTSTTTESTTSTTTSPTTSPTTEGTTLISSSPTTISRLVINNYYNKKNPDDSDDDSDSDSVSELDNLYKKNRHKKKEIKNIHKDLKKKEKKKEKKKKEKGFKNQKLVMSKQSKASYCVFIGGMCFRIPGKN